MGMKLYVGNLGYSVSGTELEQLFESHGTVESATVINDRSTGQSKGFGFVEMGSNEEASAAIAALTRCAAIALYAPCAELRDRRPFSSCRADECRRA